MTTNESPRYRTGDAIEISIGCMWTEGTYRRPAPGGEHMVSTSRDGAFPVQSERIRHAALREYAAISGGVIVWATGRDGKLYAADERGHIALVSDAQADGRATRHIATRD